MPIKINIFRQDYEPIAQYTDDFYRRLGEGSLFDIGVVREALKKDDRYTGYYKVELITRQGVIKAVQLFPFATPNAFFGGILEPNTRVLIAYAGPDRIPIILGCLPFSMEGIHERGYSADLEEGSVLYRSEKTKVKFSKNGKIEETADTITQQTENTEITIDSSNIYVKNENNEVQIEDDIDVRGNVNINGNFKQVGDEVILKSHVKLGRGPFYQSALKTEFVDLLEPISMTVTITPPVASYSPGSLRAIKAPSSTNDVEVS